jgi:hypothetical protein
MQEQKITNVYDIIYLIRSNQKNISDFGSRDVEMMTFFHWKTLLLIRPDLINEVKVYLTKRELIEIFSVNPYCVSYYID